MIIIEFIKEWIESRKAKKKIRAIYGGDPPIHKGLENYEKNNRIQKR